VGAPPGVYVASPPSAPPTLVSQTGRKVNGLDVSTSGTSAVITYNDTTTDKIVFLPTRNTTRSLRVTGTSVNVTGPVLSPNTAQVAWLEGNQSTTGLDAWVTTTAGGASPRRASPTRATATATLNASRLSWSGDSRYLAVMGDFTTNNDVELHVFDTTTGNTTVLVDGTAAAVNSVVDATWAANGQLIVRKTSGGLLTCTTTGACVPLPGCPATATISALAISPDRSFLIYGSNERPGSTSDLYRLPSAGGTATRVAVDAPLGWRVASEGLTISPDAQWVGALTTAGQFFVFSLIASNTTVTPLVGFTAPVGPFAPRFWADSSQLSFRADAATDGAYDVHRLQSLTSPDASIVLQSAAGGNITDFFPR